MCLCVQKHHLVVTRTGTVAYSRTGVPPIRRFQTAGRVRGASVRHWGSVVSVQKQRNADIQGSGIESVYIYKGTVSETKSELRSSVKVEVDVLGSPPLMNLRFLWT